MFLWLANNPLQVDASTDNHHSFDVHFQAVKDADPVLIYGESDGFTFTVAKISKSSSTGNKQKWNTDAFSQVTPVTNGMKISNMMASPDGEFIAVEVYNDVYPSTWIINLHDGRMFPLLAKGFSHFLGWHPDSQRVILRVEDSYVSDPGLWFVDVRTNKHMHIDIPDLSHEGLLNAAVSPDGSKIAYAYSKGMGFGSELWVMDLSSNAAWKIRTDRYGIMGYILWSPNGKQIAFTELLDSPVPFSQGGLWSVNVDGSNLTMLADAVDSGHGQRPVFSADGNHFYFIERSNPENKNANYDPDALTSSIQSVELSTGDVTELVAANGAKQLDISLSSDGGIFFISNRGGGAAEIWVLDIDGNLQQITNDGHDKQHPLIVSTNN